MLKHLALLLLMLGGTCAGDDIAEDYARALSLPHRVEGKLWRGKFDVHWEPGGSRFWYSVRTGPSSREWVQVQPETGEVKRSASPEDIVMRRGVDGRSVESDEPASLHFANHRTEPVELLWIDPAGHARSYGRLEPDASRLQQTFFGHVWHVSDLSGGVLREVAGGEVTEVVIEPGDHAVPKPPPSPPPVRPWTVRIENHQIILHDTASGEETPLTTDGSAAETYRGPERWSPDGRCFVAFAVRPAPVRMITEVESSPPDQVQPKVRTFAYPKPGDDLSKVRPVLFYPAEKRCLAIDTTLFPNAFTPDGRLEVTWSPASDEFFFDYNQRGHQLYRILAVNVATGAVRTVVEEAAQTFIDYQDKTWRHWLPATKELLWMSERDGWCHLYLYDAATGTVKNQVTRGPWVVREVLWVDDQARQLWLMASGRPESEAPGAQETDDPYNCHLLRVNFDGTGLTSLTPARGNHFVEFSPDRRYFVDRWSRVDVPPAAVLRRSEDGAQIAALEQADAADLLAAGWTTPEPFVAKGRDGRTDILGILIKPSNFDSTRRYPVLEEVYAGPHGAFVPKDFSLLLRQHALAELGFIVVQADGMGTNHRGKAFHDVAWQNLQDGGFPDRIAWIKAAAQTRPWMDLTRVGIYGGSAGGQNAMRALLDFHDFYRAAFADCGCHDNRMDKLWWNEQWLGWPVGEAYARASNVVDAHKLQGALMLCVGELDTNVDPASTMQVVSALEKAGKDFELLVIPGANHGAAETPYGSRRRMDFFVRHLLGAEPPRP